MDRPVLFLHVKMNTMNIENEEEVCVLTTVMLEKLILKDAFCSHTHVDGEHIQLSVLHTIMHYICLITFL
jgi:hypothetical protein